MLRQWIAVLLLASASSVLAAPVVQTVQTDRTLFCYSTDTSNGTIHELVESKDKIISVSLSFMPSSGVGTNMIIADIRTDTTKSAEVTDSIVNVTNLDASGRNKLQSYAYSLVNDHGVVTAGVSLDAMLPDFTILNAHADMVPYGPINDQYQRIFRITADLTNGSDAAFAAASVSVPEPSLLLLFVLFFFARRPSRAAFSFTYS